MKIKSVAILGMGAVGSYMLWGLSNKKNLDLCVIADGDRKERYESNGFIINGRVYFLDVKIPEKAAGVDLLIISTKYNALEGALEDIKKIVKNDTIVMSLLNGVDSEEIIAKAIGEENIVYSLIKIASERKGNSVKFNPETTMGVILEEKSGEQTERLDAIAELFNDTGINYKVSDSIINEIWTKFRLNVPDNQIQAIIGCGIGAYNDSEHMKFLQDKVRDELDEIAKAKNIEYMPNPFSVPGSKGQDKARYSTLQDLDAKRHTEVDMFSGAVIKMGKELGIPTPYNEFVFHAIKALEEKNDGKFDYN